MYSPLETCAERSRSRGLRGVLILTITLSIFSCSTSKQTSSKNDEYNPEVTALFLDASKQKLIGNYDKAIEFALQALELDKENAAILFELSQLYTYTNSFGTATDYAEGAVAVEPNNEWYNMQLAYLYKANGLHNEATKVFEHLVKKYPNKVNHYFNLIESYKYIGQNQKAVETVVKLEEIIGVSEETSLEKRDLYLSLKNKSEAIHVIQDLVDMYPSEARYYGYLAETYEAVGENEKAFETYEKVLKMDAESGIVHFYMFQYYLKQNNETEAIKHLPFIFKSDEVSIDLKMQLMLNLYERNTEYYNKISYELLDILIAQSSTEAKAHSIYADFLRRDRRFEEAIDRYRMAVELDNTRFPIWQELMFLEIQTSKFDLLKTDSERALEVFPSQPIFYLFSGLANNQLKNYPKAIESLNAGKSLVIDDKQLMGEFYQYLGESYHKNKDYEKSDKNFELALEIDPKNPTLLNNYSYYLSQRKEKLDRAEAMIKSVIERYPNEPHYIDTYGWVLFQSGKYEEARTQIKKAIDLGSKSGEVFEHYGDVLFKLGMKNEALEYWQKALETKEHSEFLEKKIADQTYYE